MIGSARIAHGHRLVLPTRPNFREEGPTDVARFLHRESFLCIFPSKTQKPFFFPFFLPSTLPFFFFFLVSSPLSSSNTHAQETAAAVKVQSVARRNQCMAALEAQGVTTAAIRNRSRRRRARQEARGLAGSADIPNLFACCGVGLAFGEATEENYEATRRFEKEQYLERKKEKAAKEEELRARFQKMAAQRKAARSSDVEEVFEVVDENEDEDDDETEE